MRPARQLLYLAIVTLCLAAIIKAAQVALTPEFLAAAEIALAGAFGNVVVQALLVTLGFVWLISLCVMGCERAERRHADWCARLEETEKQTNRGQKAA